MPIDIDEFEARSDEELKAEPAPMNSELLAFLAYDPEKAYTLEELRSGVDMPPIELAARLEQLKAEGLVRKRGSYWAVTEKAAQQEELEEVG